MWLKTGFTRDGEITGSHIKTWLDGGAYGSYGVASTFYTGVINPVTYKMPIYKFEGARVFTNKPPCGPKRGHGTPQPRFALECQLDKAAEQLGLDPADMRRRIVADPYTKPANHLTVTTIGLGECIDKVVEASGWRAKRAAFADGTLVGDRTLGERRRKGIGIACSAYMTGAGTAIYWNSMPHSGVILRADRSGGVTILCGATDIGQGSDSILAYLPAEVLGLDPKDIHVHPADTSLTPVDLGSYSSRIVELSVDEDTAEIHLDDVWIAHDIGRALNPLLVEGQVEGSIYMGIGEALMEEQVFRHDVHKAPSLLDYKSPTTLETPPIHTILVETDDPEGPFGAKEAGQGPLLPVIPAIANAVYNAVGVRVDEIPITADKILKGLDLKRQGKTARIGPERIPLFTFKEPLVVESAFGQPLEAIAVRPLADPEPRPCRDC